MKSNQAEVAEWKKVVNVSSCPYKKKKNRKEINDMRPAENLQKGARVLSMENVR